jgi:hypothetical protein
VEGSSAQNSSYNVYIYITIRGCLFTIYSKKIYKYSTLTTDVNTEKEVG